MRAYRCDICKHVYLMPETRFVGDDGIEYDDVNSAMPAELNIYPQRGMVESYDICKDCLDKLLDFIETVPEKE